ncbi:Flagellar hook-length control protein [Saliniradius amylolyticus]|uniref:Flagellar hook-length control protein n=1 Tax=Saliniradius amylolyticus TaxID=2183582 RepID=A0A2S2E4H2_9ALTE|nr:flagellar hook-length control protein FliK [Saliniradius amylolyticus]AWL12558.1 Flagellar hook-length control protein [Saliniradius amylolyticus]
MQQVATPNPAIAAPKVKGSESRSPQTASESNGAFSEHFTRQQAANESKSAKQTESASRTEVSERAAVSTDKDNRISDKPKHDSERSAKKGEAASQGVKGKTREHPEATQHPDQHKKAQAESDKTAASSQSAQSPAKPIQAEQKDHVEEGESPENQHWLDLIHELADQHISQQGSVDKQKQSEDVSEEVTSDPDDNAPSMAKWLEQLGFDADRVLQELDGEQRQQLEAIMAELQATDNSGEPKELVHFLDKLTRFLQQQSADKGEAANQDNPEDMPLDPKWLNGQTQKLLQAINQFNKEADGEGPGQEVKVGVQELTLLRQQLMAQESTGLTTETESDEVLQLIRDKLLKIQGKGTADVSSAGASDSGNNSTASNAEPDMERTLKALARLSDTKLDQALSQASQALQGADESEKSSFISSLKAGVEEMKAQLKQGREPGLDLKALVAQALSSEGESSDKQTATLQDAIQRLTSLTDSQSRAQAQTSPPAELMNSPMAAERAGVGHVEATSGSKAAQPTSSPAGQMERAINIAKSEAAQQLADRVRMLVDQGNMSADIRLDPPDLGSMQIRVQMNGEQASVNMTVQNQQAKEMLDQAMPRLRELLSEKGIELGQSSVEQEQQQAQEQSSQGQGAGGSSEGHDGEQGEDSETGVEMSVVNGSLGGIDYFV